METVAFQFGPRTVQRRKRQLRFGSHTTVAKRRLGVPLNGGSKPTDIWVVSGPHCQGRFSQQQSQLVSAFANKLVLYRNEPGLTAVPAWKESLGKKNWGHLRVFRVAWDLGPIPVVQIGEIECIPICSTSFKLEYQGSLETTSHANAEIVLRALNYDLQICFDEYLKDVCEAFKGIFFGPRCDALQQCRKIKKQIGISIKDKIEFLSALDLNLKLNTTKARIQEKFQLDIRIARATSNLVLKSLAMIEACLTGRNDIPKMGSKDLDLIMAIPDHASEREVLLDCADLLARPPEFGKLAHLKLDKQDQRAAWADDLLIACRMLGEIQALVGEFGADPLFIFVSHHMGTYASDLFFRLFATAAEKKYGGRVKVWTGIGRHEDLQLPILARIWMSDLHVFYIPNSLDTIKGGKKSLHIESDWLIDELFYGQLIKKTFHIVEAETTDPREPSIREQLKMQVAQFKWENLSHTFSNFQLAFADEDYLRIGRSLSDSLSRTFRETFYSVHHAQVDVVTTDDMACFEKNFLRPCVTEKLREILQTFRLGFSRDDWRIVLGLVNSSEKARGISGSPFVTIKAIHHMIATERRSDQSVITVDWIGDVIRDRIKGRSLGFSGREFSLIEEGKRIRDGKTYCFALDGFAQEFVGKFGVKIDTSDLMAVFWNVIRRPVSFAIN
jgi:hypothetical protein